MAYKDKDKQREAGRERARRYREAHQKALLSEGVTDKALPNGNVSIETLAIMDAGCGDKLSHGLKRGKDIKCQMTVMERLFYRPAHLLKPGETNFVSLPGRACYGVV